MKYYSINPKGQFEPVLVNLTREEADRFKDNYGFTTEIKPQPKRLLVNLETFYIFKAQIATQMIDLGGSFVRALGEALLHADVMDSQRIYSTFHEYVANYYINYLNAKEHANKNQTENA